MLNYNSPESIFRAYFMGVIKIGGTEYMQRALQLAYKGWGKTSPNPMVGAVVVKDDQIIGEGYHRSAGDWHAEVVALRDAGDEAEGADLYVNLEPCCHHGRTPPCTDAIIDSKIKRVIGAMPDPNPEVSGKGFARLRSAGMCVETGLLRETAEQLNETYVKHVETGKPFVLIKMAMTLDGKIASKTGHSEWVSSWKSREYVHHYRAGYDAVMIGSGTMQSDDPQLTYRLGDRDDVIQPLRVVVDSKCRMTTDANMFQDIDDSSLFIATTDQARESKISQLRAVGAEVVVVGQSTNGVDLVGVMEVLGDKGVTSVLVEGGGEFNWGLLESGLADKIMFFVAPKLIGGRNAPTPVEGDGIEKITHALQLNGFEVEFIGDDLCITGYVAEKGGVNVHRAR